MLINFANTLSNVTKSWNTIQNFHVRLLLFCVPASDGALLTLGTVAFFESEIWEEEDPEEDDPTGVAPLYEEVPQITDLVTAGIIPVKKTIRERYMFADTSLEDALLNSTTAATTNQCTWKTVSDMIASNPTSSYIVLSGIASMRPTRDRLMLTMMQFQGKLDLVKNFIEWQKWKKKQGRSKDGAN